jgi:hypothetical protein
MLNELENEIALLWIVINVNVLIPPKEIADLWTNERLLNVVEQFIGPEIAGHPVWNIRSKVSPFYFRSSLSDNRSV